jgi:hypothetical protein
MFSSSQVELEQYCKNDYLEAGVLRLALCSKSNSLETYAYQFLPMLTGLCKLPAVCKGIGSFPGREKH